MNHFEYKCISGNITSFISDHLPQFIIFEKFKENNTTKNDNQTVFRDFKNLNMDAFDKDLSAIDWSLATENIDTDLSFKTFLRLFHRALDKHAPLKKTTKREKKEKIKPWVTKGIIKSIKVRGKLYKEFIRSKIPQEREYKYSAFKKYRNKLIGLLKISRQSHYQNYFNEKKNSRALWQGINEIIYSKKAYKTNSPSSLLVDNKTITNIPQMTEHFNQYFTSIGKNLQKRIPPTKRQFSDYLKDSNQNSFFIQPTTAEELKDIILTLMSSKSTGPNRIPTFLLKQTRNTVSLPLAKLISKSFETGIFPDICKVAKVVPIFKSETRLLCNNYRPICLLSNTGKVIEKLMHQRLPKSTPSNLALV